MEKGDNQMDTGKRSMNMLSAIVAQRRWIDEHGPSLAGYIERYGEDRGHTIWAADNQELQRLVNKAYRYDAWV
jgi:hypothetical protein